MKRFLCAGETITTQELGDFENYSTDKDHDMKTTVAGDQRAGRTKSLTNFQASTNKQPKKGNNQSLQTQEKHLNQALY